MKNINQLLLVSLIALSFSLHAKNEPTATSEVTTNNPSITDTASLEKALDMYKNLQIEGDVYKSIELIYPPVFEILPKEATLEAFNIAKEGGMLPKDTKYNQKVNFPIKTYDKGAYTAVSYTIESSIDMTPPKSDKARTAQLDKMKKNPEELVKFKSFMENMLKAVLGSDSNIAFQKGSMIVDVKKSGTYLAINENDAGWRFVDLSPIFLEKIKGILPKEIVDNEKPLFDELSKNAIDPMQAMMDAMAKGKN